MSIKDRYLSLIEIYAGGIKRNFAKKIGVAPTVVENICGTRETSPSFKVLQKTIVAFENISVHWLITGKGDMYINEKVNEPQEEYLKNQNKDMLDKLLKLTGENALLKKENKDLKTKLKKSES